MATVAATTTGRVELIDTLEVEQTTLLAAVDITAPSFVRANASGKWEVALATSAGAAAGARFAPRSVKAGMPLTAYRKGKFGGFNVTQAFNAPLYLSDTGTLADAAGTASVQVGRVIPGTANPVAQAHDKNVEINCPE